MTPDNLHCLTPGFPQGGADHLVGNRSREQHQKIRVADALQGGIGFWENLGLATVFPADFHIPPGHTFIASYDYHTHGPSPF